MASTSARQNGFIGLIVAVIVAELVFGVFGLGAKRASASSHVRPVTAVVDAAFTASPPTSVLAVHADPMPTPIPSTSKRKPVTATAPHRASAKKVTTAPRTAVTTPTASQSGWGCAAADSWLSSHSAPGYQFVCPGYAEGHQAMTCNNTSACPGVHLIVIAIPCPAAYMNEAHNSWIISGLATGKIDPYGYCS